MCETFVSDWLSCLDITESPLSGASLELSFGCGPDGWKTTRNHGIGNQYNKNICSGLSEGQGRLCHMNGGYMKEKTNKRSSEEKVNL